MQMLKVFLAHNVYSVLFHPNRKRTCDCPFSLMLESDAEFIQYYLNWMASKTNGSVVFSTAISFHSLGN